MISSSLVNAFLLHYSSTIQTTQFLIILYTDPGSVLPLASGAAAVIGFILLIWQRFMTFLSRTLRFLRGKNQA